MERGLVQGVDAQRVPHKGRRRRRSSHVRGVIAARAVHPRLHRIVAWASSQWPPSGAKKIAVAAILTLQVTAMVLTLRYSKTTARYLSSTAVVCAEFVKMLVCVVVLTWTYGAGIGDHLMQELLMKPRDMVLVSVPAFLYLIQNNLLFYAMEHLDAAVYQVTYQLKILTTAICTVLMLDRRLTTQQWVALIVLTAGVALAQLQPPSKDQPKHSASLSSQTAGILALLVACFTSGFAGVYTEKLLKQTQASLWIRNLQLAVWSIVAGFIGIFSTNDGAVVMEKGFFDGYTQVVWCVVVLQACSGIVVALVIKIADNIVKNFSVAMSLLLSTVVSMVFQGFEPSPYFVVGAMLVLASVQLYSTSTTYVGHLPERRAAKDE
eukprot:TRINITY_DN1064_c0_g1_i11.p2 TRINITY_DN1064_c0_g1~~TRINITY_DN1064_c0_g1_i11.p2  ORF type:complete len:378 (+),score=116.78 TRINITY_DN1064_c0_g1_i11:1338-2471(+)